MKYLKIVFILFGLFELLACYGSLMSTPASINADFNGQFMTPEGMHFVNGFGYALLAISTISILGFWIQERFALLVLVIGFLVYNLCSVYGCYVDIDLSTKYQIGFYIHSLFSVLFFLMLIFLLKKDN